MNRYYSKCEKEETGWHVTCFQIFIIFHMLACNDCIKLIQSHFMWRHVSLGLIVSDLELFSILINIVFRWCCHTLRDGKVCTSSCWPWADACNRTKQKQYTILTRLLHTLVRSTDNFSITRTLYTKDICFETSVYTAFNCAKSVPIL
jgi:hypothetical protein